LGGGFDRAASAQGPAAIADTRQEALLERVGHMRLADEPARACAREESARQRDLAELPDRAAVDTMFADEPYVRAGLYASVEVRDWRFGGRPSATR
jgi:uncharacterized protein YciI